MRRIVMLLVLACSLAAAQQAAPPAAAPAPAAPPAVTEVAPTDRYVDELNGFSLAPPAGCERVRETSSRRLVEWVCRDSATHGIRWSLEVLKVHLDPAGVPLDLPPAELSKKVVAKLASENFHVEQTQLTTLAGGKPAMIFQGPWTGALGLWRRQTWVQVRPGEFLVMDISGRPDDKARMESTAVAVAASLQLQDPTAAMSQRQQNLDRGAKLLLGLDVAKLQGLVAKEPSWYALTLSGSGVGMLKVSESVEKRSGVQALSVTRLGVARLPEQPRRLSVDDMFSAPDRQVSSARRTIIDGEGDRAVRTVFEIVRQDTVLLADVKANGQAQPSRQKRITPNLDAWYLPQAMDVILPRLLDLKTPSAYSFAIYNVDANDFDIRTVRVIGPEKVNLGGKEFDAVHLTDQMAADEPAVNLWVSPKGVMLKLETSGGLVIQRTTKASVTALYAADLKELEAGTPPAP